MSLGPMVLGGVVAGLAARSLKTLALTTVVATRIPLAAWATGQFANPFQHRRDVRKHGLYHLLHLGAG